MTVQAGLCQTCSETTLLVFPRDGSNYDMILDSALSSQIIDDATWTRGYLIFVVISAEHYIYPAHLKLNLNSDGTEMINIQAKNIFRLCSIKLGQVKLVGRLTDRLDVSHLPNVELKRYSFALIPIFKKTKYGSRENT